MNSGDGDGGNNNVQKTFQEQTALEAAKSYSFEYEREILKSLVRGHSSRASVFP